MIGPVSMSNPQVYFRANDADLSAPGKFSSAASETEGDKADLSTEAKPKKGGVLKTIGLITGGIVALAGASFGLFKAKGDKWLAGEAKGFVANAKKWLVKPGEFINNKMINPIIERLSSKGKGDQLEELIDEIEEQVANA